MIYLAVFFGSGGHIDCNDDGMPEAEQVGLFKNKNQAIAQAESKYEAHHICRGVCMLNEKAQTRARFGFMVYSLKSFVEEFNPQ